MKRTARKVLISVGGLAILLLVLLLLPARCHIPQITSWNAVSGVHTSSETPKSKPIAMSRSELVAVLQQFGLEIDPDRVVHAVLALSGDRAVANDTLKVVTEEQLAEMKVVWQADIRPDRRSGYLEDLLGSVEWSTPYIDTPTSTADLAVGGSLQFRGARTVVAYRSTDSGADIWGLHWVMRDRLTPEYRSVSSRLQWPVAQPTGSYPNPLYGVGEYKREDTDEGTGGE